MATRRKRLVGSLTVSALLKPLSPLCGMDDFVVPNQSQSKKNKSWSSKRVASAPSSYVNEDPSSYDLIDRKPTRSNKQPLGKFVSRLRESFRPKPATSSRGRLQLPRDAQEAKNVSPNSSRLSAAPRYPQPNVESSSTHSGASPSTSLSDVSLHNFTFPLRKEIEHSNGESDTTTSYQQESSFKPYFLPPCESPTTLPRAKENLSAEVSKKVDWNDSGPLERCQSFLLDEFPNLRLDNSEVKIEDRFSNSSQLSQSIISNTIDIPTEIQVSSLSPSLSNIDYNDLVLLPESVPKANMVPSRLRLSTAENGDSLADYTTLSEALTEFQQTYATVAEAYSNKRLSPVDLTPPPLPQSTILPSDSKKISKSIIPGQEEKVGRNSSLAKRNSLPNNAVLKSARIREPEVFTRGRRFSDLFKSRDRSKSASDFEKERIPAESKSKLSVRSARSVEKGKRIKPNPPGLQSLQAIPITNDLKFSNESGAGSVGHVDSKRKGWGPRRWLRSVSRRHSASEGDDLQSSTTLGAESVVVESKVPMSLYSEEFLSEFGSSEVGNAITSRGNLSCAIAVLQSLIRTPPWVMDCLTNNHGLTCLQRQQHKPCADCTFSSFSLDILNSYPSSPVEDFLRHLLPDVEENSLADSGDPREIFDLILGNVEDQVGVNYFKNLFSIRYEIDKRCGHCKEVIERKSFVDNCITVKSIKGGNIEDMILKSFEKQIILPEGGMRKPCPECSYPRYDINHAYIISPPECLAVVIDRSKEVKSDNLDVLTIPSILDLSPIGVKGREYLEDGLCYEPYAAVIKHSDKYFASLCTWLNNRVYYFDEFSSIDSVREITTELEFKGLLGKASMVFFRRVKLPRKKMNKQKEELSNM